jgi:hypothetical protein
VLRATLCLSNCTLGTAFRPFRLRVYLCRDEHRAIPFVFKSHSLIMVAGHRRWWANRSQRLRRLLEAAGHFVVFVDTSEHRDDVRECCDVSPAAPMRRTDRGSAGWRRFHFDVAAPTLRLRNFPENSRSAATPR